MNEPASDRMLGRGSAVPHFEVKTPGGVTFRYPAIWQRRSLVLVTLAAAGSEAEEVYLGRLDALRTEFDRVDTEVVVTRDRVRGVPAPGAIVADRWGEVVHVAAAPGAAELPSPEDLLDWSRYVQVRCPECEGEAR